MRRGSVKSWACIVSVGVHLLVLGGFGFVKFSGAGDEADVRVVPTNNISQMKKVFDATPIMPKPKIERIRERQFDRQGETLAGLDEIFEQGQVSVGVIADFEKNWKAKEEIFQGEKAVRGEVDFFGSKTEGRKVCFVVDCSGSMRGIFSRVQKELVESIGRLEQDQYFYIVFFGSDRLFEFGDGRMVRANDKNKSVASDFVDSIKPAGQTNALAALQRGMQIRDSRGESASVIYFLSDGFELSGENMRWFGLQVENIRKRLAVGAQINTIGFWPQDEDREMLELIAAESGGQAIFVDE